MRTLSLSTATVAALGSLFFSTQAYAWAHSCATNDYNYGPTSTYLFAANSVPYSEQECLRIPQYACQARGLDVKRPQSWAYYYRDSRTCYFNVDCQEISACAW